MNKKMRSEFEAWMNSTQLVASLALNSDDSYVNMQVQYLWASWQAATALKDRTAAIPSEGLTSKNIAAFPVFELVKITAIKFDLVDKHGNQLCRIGEVGVSSKKKRGIRESNLISKFIANACNAYTQRCDDSEIPFFDDLETT